MLDEGVKNVDGKAWENSRSRLDGLIHNKFWALYVRRRA
jgi:hypothetical protein